MAKKSVKKPTAKKAVKKTARPAGKKTSKKTLSNKKLHQHEETFSKEFSPFADIHCNLLSQTPKKYQLEYLQSPISIKKDLFSQLLGTDSKAVSPYQISF